MKKTLILVSAMLFLAVFSFADTSTFTVTTDANGYVKDTDNVAFGKITLNSFSATHSFASVNILVDGASKFNSAVAGGNTYALTGAVARQNFQLIGTGGPANTSVTVTINYTFSAFRSVSSTTTDRDTDTFTVTTTAGGALSESENIAFGKITLNSFSANYAFANINIVVDGASKFNTGIAAGQTYAITGAVARKNFQLIGTGGPANTAVTVSINYTFSAFRESTTVDRDTDTFTVTTTAGGALSESENIAFGKITLNTFLANYGFSNVNIVVDGASKFNSGVAANQSYALSGAAARKNFQLIGTGGPANTAVTVTIGYTFSPFRYLGEDDRSGVKVETSTDKNGDALVKEKEFESCNKPHVWMFKTSMKFEKLILFIDNAPVALKPSSDNPFLYFVDVKLTAGNHTLGIIAQGGEPEKEVAFFFFHK